MAGHFERAGSILYWVDPDDVYVPVTPPHNAMSDQDWADATDGYPFPPDFDISPENTGL